MLICWSCSLLRILGMIIVKLVQEQNTITHQACSPGGSLQKGMWQQKIWVWVTDLLVNQELRIYPKDCLKNHSTYSQQAETYTEKLAEDGNRNWKSCKLPVKEE